MSPERATFVQAAGPAEWQGVLTPVSLRHMTGRKPIVVGENPSMGNEAPDQVLFNPGGTIAYAVYPGIGAVVPVHTATGTPGKPIPVGYNADAAVMTRPGRLLYVETNRLGITVINTATRAAIFIRTGMQQAGHLTISPDGRTVFAFGTRDGEQCVVTPITIATSHAGKPVTVGDNPVAMIAVP
jgi:hypothetical protein